MSNIYHCSIGKKPTDADYSKGTISAGVIISYRVIIGLSHEKRLSKYVMLLGNVYTV